MKQSAIAISIGCLSTLVLVLSLWFGALEIARLGVEPWTKEKINEQTKNKSVEEISDIAQEIIQEYYSQWNIVSLQVVLISLGFLVGGFITAKVSKSKVFLHSSIVGGAVSLITLSLFIPVYVMSAIAGAYLAKSKTNEKYI